MRLTPASLSAPSLFIVLPAAGGGDFHLVVDYHKCQHPRNLKAEFRNTVWGKRKIEEGVRAQCIADKLEVRKVWKEKYCRPLGINLRNQRKP